MARAHGAPGGERVIPAAALAAALAAVPGATAAVPRIAPLAGGLVNRSFRVATAAGDFVLRLHGSAAEALALGIDRGVEIAAQRLAADAGLAPRVVACAPDFSWLVTEFVAGEVADATTLATPRAVVALGATLRQLRERVGEKDVVACALASQRAGASTSTPAAAPAAAASLIERARRLVARARVRVDATEDARLATLLERAEAGWLAAGSGRPRCLVHSDPNPGNVLLPAHAAAAVLLDWEYAHVGDPLQDPAAWLQACPALQGREPELLRACGLESLADAPMLGGMVAVYEALAHAWNRLAETAAGIPPGGRAN